MPFAIPANATLLLSEETFRDLGATGFGNAPRLLTIQNDGFEAGGTFDIGAGGTGFTTGAAQTVCTAATCPVHQPSTGTNESKVYSVGSLGWLQGVNVGIGLDTNETGNVSGLTFDTLVLKLYNSSGTLLGTFSGDGPVTITAAQLAAQQGNGNSVFDIRLSLAEQAQYNAILAANGGAFNVFEGLSASFGCAAGAPAGCLPSTDGAESFLAFNAVPGPLAGAGLPGIIAMGVSLIGLARRRRKQWLDMFKTGAH
jgi:hypothetical protein